MELILPTTRKLDELIKNIKNENPDKEIMLSRSFLSFPIGIIEYRDINLDNKKWTAEKEIRIVYINDIIERIKFTNGYSTEYVNYIKNNFRYLQEQEFYKFQISPIVEEHERIKRKIGKSKYTKHEREFINFVKNEYISYLKSINEKNKKTHPSEINHILSNYFRNEKINKLNMSYVDELSNALFFNRIIITTSNIQRNLIKYANLLLKNKEHLHYLNKDIILYFFSIGKDWYIKEELIIKRNY